MDMTQSEPGPRRTVVPAVPAGDPDRVAPPIESRRWLDPEDDVRYLADLTAKLRGQQRVTTLEAEDYANLLARQTMRRELVALRTRVVEWAKDYVAENPWIDPSPEFEDPTLKVMRDMVDVLDARISDRGGVEPVTAP